jgi:hypothetical protein
MVRSPIISFCMLSPATARPGSCAATSISTAPTIGRECDTQVDPTAVLDLVCHPAEFPGENPPDRRPFARGPGIRGPQGSLITDWTFQKVVPECSESSLDSPSSPFGKPGVTAYRHDQLRPPGLRHLRPVQHRRRPASRPRPRVSPTIDPLGLLDATIQPHMLWPHDRPAPGQRRHPRASAHGRRRAAAQSSPVNSEGADALKSLAPSLRRIDLAYCRDRLQLRLYKVDVDGDAELARRRRGLSERHRR